MIIKFDVVVWIGLNSFCFRSCSLKRSIGLTQGVFVSKSVMVLVWNSIKMYCIKET